MNADQGLGSDRQYTLTVQDMQEGPDSVTRKFGITLAALYYANPSLTGNDQWFPGRTILIPFPHPHHTYLSEPNEDLEAIARKFGISLQTLKDENPQIMDPLFLRQPVEIPW
jgi:LysM domain